MWLGPAWAAVSQAPRTRKISPNKKTNKQTLTIPVQNWAQEFFIHFEPPVLSLSPKIGVCISVFKFWRQEKIPLMNPKTARRKI